MLKEHEDALGASQKSIVLENTAGRLQLQSSKAFDSKRASKKEELDFERLRREQQRNLESFFENISTPKDDAEKDTVKNGVKQFVKTSKTKHQSYK